MVSCVHNIFKKMVNAWGVMYTSVNLHVCIRGKYSRTLIIWTCWDLGK